MQYVFLKSGVLIIFNLENCKFTFNEAGYFVGNVDILVPSESVTEVVESFTFHIDEMSCHWIN